MPGLIFEDTSALGVSAPNRTDVALFVGFVRARPGASIPAVLSRWLELRGWTSKPYGQPRKTVEDLVDLPIQIEGWKQFAAIFDWENRTPDRRDGATYLGAAVRSFFAQGGRKCYVVRAGDPFALETGRDDRVAAIAKLIPGYPNSFDASPADRFSWRGVGHLFGLPDVSFVCVPDLADCVAIDRLRVPVPDAPPPPQEEFVECSTPVAPAPPDRTVRGVGAPTCDLDGFELWAGAVRIVTEMLALRRIREVQLIVAVPIPDARLAFDLAPPSAALQLAYPWVRTPASGGLPEKLESPDGVLAGILARNALLQGTYRSAAGQNLGDVYDIYPDLDRHEQARDRLIERLSLMGETPAGLRLLSDATMSGDQMLQFGVVTRLIGTIVRNARRLGEEVVFESSGEKLWGDVRNRLGALMRGLYEAGAFRGASPAEAYQVRCDRSTMSQNDIDSGRVIAHLQFDAAAPVDTITVALAVNDDRSVSAIESEAA